MKAFREIKTNRKVVQKMAPWGLSAISRSKDGEYRYDSSAGTDVYAFVVDTGIDIRHYEFQDRATVHNFISPTDRPSEMNHGTGVAAVLGGTKYGVAKNVKLIDMRVGADWHDEEGLLRTSIPRVNINKALTTILNNITANSMGDGLPKPKGRAVVNMSLGFEHKSWPSDEEGCEDMHSIIDDLIKEGVHVVIAAGNEDQHHGNVCPGNHPDVITVAASEEDDNRWEHSNWGKGVDLYAPGTLIKTAVSGTRDGHHFANGTSFAAPHVAGVVAYLIELEGPRSPKDMLKRLKELAAKGQIDENKGKTPNRFLYNGIDSHHSHD